MRVVPHAICFSALPALLVVVTRERLGVGAGAYGALYGCFGVGGALGALLLPRLRARIATDRLLPVAATVFAAMLAGLATLESVAALLPLMLVGGAASMTVLVLVQHRRPVGAARLGAGPGPGRVPAQLSGRDGRRRGAVGGARRQCRRLDHARGRRRGDDRHSPARPGFRAAACGGRRGRPHQGVLDRAGLRPRAGAGRGADPRGDRYRIAPGTRPSSLPRCESSGAPGGATAPCSGRCTRTSPIRNGMSSRSWSLPGRSTSASTSAPCARTGRRSSASWRCSAVSRHGSHICSRELRRAAAGRRVIDRDDKG